VSQVKQLYDLQQIDLDVEMVTEALQQIQAKLSDNAELLQAKAELERENGELHELEKRQHTAEWEIDDLRAKIEPLKKKLYGGSVKNPKELMTLQEEVEYLNKRINEKEDSALELMSEVESTHKRTDKMKQQVEELEKRWHERETALLAERSELETQLADAKRRREASVAAIDRAELDLYEYLRVGRRKPTVAKVEQGRCQGCRITLPVNKLQQVRARRSLVQCDSCERILFLE
jgi:predicted  nucleic acid-binding Zn-ribbon protein